jgi:hypothetical protein
VPGRVWRGKTRVISFHIWLKRGPPGNEGKDTTCLRIRPSLQDGSTVEADNIQPLRAEEVWESWDEGTETDPPCQ